MARILNIPAFAVSRNRDRLGLGAEGGSLSRLGCWRGLATSCIILSRFQDFRVTGDDRGLCEPQSRHQILIVMSRLPLTRVLP
jgi:hypothetical protein